MPHVHVWVCVAFMYFICAYDYISYSVLGLLDTTFLCRKTYRQRAYNTGGGSGSGSGSGSRDTYIGGSGSGSGRRDKEFIVGISRFRTLSRFRAQAAPGGREGEEGEEEYSIRNSNSNSNIQTQTQIEEVEMEEEEGEEEEDFVDMFAAKKRLNKGQLGLKSNQSKKLGESSSNSNLKSKSSVTSKQAVDVGVSFKEREYTSRNSPGALNAVMESKAELLRLEATQEQSLIDAQQIQKEMDICIQRDGLLLEIYEGNLEINEGLCSDYPDLLCAGTFFRIAELVNTASTSGEKEQWGGYFNELMAVVKRFDSGLHADIQADIQKALTLTQNALTTKTRVKSATSITLESGLGSGSGDNPNTNTNTNTSTNTEDEEKLVKGWVEQLDGSKGEDKGKDEGSGKGKGKGN